MYKCIGTVLSFLLLGAAAKHCPNLTDNYFFLGICILLAGFMSGSN